MRWVTRETIGVDRMATAWLIARFIDKDPEFVFVPEGSGIPAPELGVAFDIPGVHLSHRHGHCTFHTVVSEYQLRDRVLDRLALIIDEADVVQEASLEPAAAGLDMICRGLRMICVDDQDAMIRSRPLFDGLYSFLQAEISKAD